MAEPSRKLFSSETLIFLNELTLNNRRDWFIANRDRYGMYVREPALKFIREMAPRLAILSPHFKADDRKVGGSLMRVYRNTRFTKDKAPYKTNIGIQFRHMIGWDVHAPGFYFHIELGQSFLGAGVWRPDNTSLYRIRSKIDEEQGRWKELINTEKVSSPSANLTPASC